jgi:hypothetical protein
MLTNLEVDLADMYAGRTVEVSILHERAKPYHADFYSSIYRER